MTCRMTAERLEEKRIFATWSVSVPLSFDEKFVDEGQYWHAWDDDRSISLTSLVITDDNGAVAASKILEQMRPETFTPEGTLVEGVPNGLIGWATTGPAELPARTSQALTGMLFMNGRALLATITADDLSWAGDIWLSIRGHDEEAAEFSHGLMLVRSLAAPNRAARRARRRGR